MKQSVPLPRVLAAVPLLAAAVPAGAQDGRVEEITVIGRPEFLEKEFSATRTDSSIDAARLMSRVPGGGVNGNGPLSGQIQYRGMFGPRVNVTIDGMRIHGGGPNWMAPPLHHIPPGLMDRLVVHRGVASVVDGGGIGGAATALWKRPDYSGGGWRFAGDAEASFAGVSGGSGVAGVAGLVSARHRFYAVGARDEGGDYESARGAVAATGYRRDASGLGYGFRGARHEFDASARRIATEDTGSPSLPMDIDWFDTEIASVSWRGRFGALEVEARAYGSEVDHGMSNFLLRPAPDFSSLPLPPFAGDDRRFVRTDSEESGFRLALDWALEGGGGLAVGVEGNSAAHNAVATDPDFAPFFVENFNESRTDSMALFGQWSALLDGVWYFEAGVRAERVDMDSGEVDGFPARLADGNPAMWPAGTPPRAFRMLRQAFNGAERRRVDANTDWVLKARRRMSGSLLVELALARKTRSPTYQERYLWIPLEINAGLGDGNTYIGDPALEPERSRQVEIGFDWEFDRLHFSPRLFRHDIDGYIQGTPAAGMAAVGVSRGANGDPTPLMFANTDARIEGLDLTLGYRIDERWRLEAIAAAVDGARRDTDDSLYRISPDSLRLALYYETGRFLARFEQLLVAEQDDISRANTLDPANPNNSHAATDGRALTNIWLRWDLDGGLRFSAGVDNLLDEDYVDHLTGFNRAPGGAVPIGARLFGPGRNLFGRLQYRW